MLKVLNVNLSIDVKSGGGTAERTFQLTRSLSKIGVKCKLLALDFDYSKDRLDKIENVELITLPCINRRFYIPIPLINKVKNLVNDVDIIHMIGHWTLLNVLVYLMAKHYHKPYVLCPAGALSYLGRSKRLKAIYNLVVGHRIIQNSAACIAITQDEISDISKYGVDKSKIIHFPNGINENEFKETSVIDFRLKFGLAPTKIILFVGRLNFIKGVDLLFNAFCNICDQIPDYQLVIAGPDEGLKKNLEKKIYQYDLADRIKLIGFLNAKYKGSAYQSSSLLVIPSRSEAMSIVVLEAGINGKAVLITDRCGFDEIRQVNGGEVVEASVTGIEKGLLNILSDNSKLSTMGANLRSYVKQNYLWENIAQDHLDLFKKIVQLD